VVILIHGRGQDPQDLEDMIVARIGLPEVAYLAPPAADGTWYPLGFMMPIEQNQPRLDFALARLAALSDALAAGGTPPSAQAIVGFSQGACLGCEFVYRNRGRRRFAALCAFTGGLIGPPGTEWEMVGDAFRDMPVLLGGASADPFVPAARMLETAAVFRGLGARVDATIHPSAVHEITDDQIVRARVILTELLGTPAPR
jgi:phospholipase/carboxylesterase